MTEIQLTKLQLANYVCDELHKEMGGVSKSMLKKSRLNFDKIEKCK